MTCWMSEKKPAFMGRVIRVEAWVPLGKGGNCEKPPLALDLGGRFKLSLRCDSTKMKECYQQLPKNTTTVTVTYSPIFLSRRSFRAVGESCVINLIPDPKPDRSHPPPLSWSHYWHHAVIPTWDEGTYHVRLDLPSSGKGGCYVQKTGEYK